MFEFMKTKKDNVIGIRCVGVLTHEDYENLLIPYLEKALNKSTPQRALCDLRDFQGMEFQAMWDDFKFGIHHTKDVERLATVGDQVWVAWLMKVSSYLYKMDLKYFPTSQIDEA